MIVLEKNEIKTQKDIKKAVELFDEGCEYENENFTSKDIKAGWYWQVEFIQVKTGLENAVYNYVLYTDTGIYVTAS